jgi:DNA repair ATPase RecN
MPNDERKLQSLKAKVKEAETELAVVNREIDNVLIDLEREHGITDPEQAKEKAGEVKRRISQYEKRIDGLLVKAETLVRQYEADLRP